MILMSSGISWDDQRTFLAVLDEGSLSAAARNLGVSQPTVRARIAALEAALGTILFTRSVNGLTPTKSAEALGSSARAMALASEVFVRTASAPPGAVSGTVRLSVPEFMGVEVVPSMLANLRKTHPGIIIELVLSNTLANLLEQEVDIAVRTTEPTQSALIARKVSVIPLGLFASADYLERRPAPLTLADLVYHDLIGPDRNRADMKFAEGMYASLAQTQFVLRTDSHPAQLAAARAGIGIVVLQVPSGNRDPVLRRVLPGQDVAQLNTWIVTHENLRVLPRIDAVFDCLVAAFAEISAPRR
jgi:DNA-binding transcriptional LysR family regulator